MSKTKEEKKGYEVAHRFNAPDVGDYEPDDTVDLTEDQAEKFKLFLRKGKSKKQRNESTNTDKAPAVITVGDTETDDSK